MADIAATNAAISLLRLASCDYSECHGATSTKQDLVVQELIGSYSEIAPRFCQDRLGLTGDRPCTAQPDINPNRSISTVPHISHMATFGDSFQVLPNRIQPSLARDRPSSDMACKPPFTPEMMHFGSDLQRLGRSGSAYSPSYDIPDKVNDSLVMFQPTETTTYRSTPQRVFPEIPEIGSSNALISAFSTPLIYPYQASQVVPVSSGASPPGQLASSSITPLISLSRSGVVAVSTCQRKSREAQRAVANSSEISLPSGNSLMAANAFGYQDSPSRNRSV